MKRLGLIALAFALVLGLSQCKKENNAIPANEDAKVPITLNVSSGSRVAVEGSTGVVTFESGDVIYVASNGTCVGTLTYNGENFAGEVTEPTEGEKLQFYFLGNKTPEFNSDNTGCSVVISDQTEYLPVISYAPSREDYQVGLTAYNATLLNKCALVKFNVTSASEAATCIVGMNNKVTVDFTDNSFEYGQDGEGVIAMPAGNGEKWAILLPQDGITHTDAYSTDGLYTGSCATIPAIEENGYLTNGIAVAINLPGGAIDGLFSVSETQQVYFSKGNLQYIGSAGNGDENNTGAYWKFADHQWDYLGANGQGSSYQTIDRDLFCWGTSGYNHGAVGYQPWYVSTNDNDFHAYGNWQRNLYDETGQADWGYNAITNGGNTENSGWRTPTIYEWYYLCFMRVTASGIRWALGTVNGVTGAILLPDEWDASIYALNDADGGTFNSNIITGEEWIGTLETNGAVFLPTAGQHEWGQVGFMGERGSYASSSYCSWYGTDWMEIYGDGVFVYINYGKHRYYAVSVRLVRNAE